MRVPVVLAAAAIVAGAGPASAATPQPPMLLPGDAAAASIDAAPGTWLVGARPGAAARRIAARHGARALLGGAYSIPRPRARALARDLRAAGVLVFAEPDRLSAPRQAPPRAIPDDPYDPSSRWRDFVVDPALAPPPVTAESPLLALIDSKLDASHPEFAGGQVSTLEGQAVEDFHGTATAAVAAAPKNDQGILGLWPGMRAINVPLPQRIRCADSTEGIVRATEAGAAVINMSYGSANACFTEFLALQFATARGINLVAAAGNEFAAGNPLEFPATLPHVLTIAAITPDGRSAFFSNENAAIDLAAPGMGILTAIPAAYDADGTPDGYTTLDGTSFSAPMVAAATAWVRAARPELAVDQVAQVVRLSAQDVGRSGWEPSTGFGVLDVGAALRREAPLRDPREPNEDIVWVDGRAFDRPDRPIFTGRARALHGLLDLYEDPADVYRIRVPGRSRVRVRVSPRFGDADLSVHSRRARSTGEARNRLGRSRRTGRRTDRVTVRNRSRRAVTAYVRVYAPRGRRSLDAAYTLRIRRL